MTWEFRYHAGPQYLEILVQGDLTPEGLNAMAVERYKKLAEHDCRKILFDFRQSRYSLSVLETYQRPAESAQIGVARTNCSAAIVSPADFEGFKFMETVYKNRGYDLNVFTTPEEAIGYLATCGTDPLPSSP